MISHRMSKRIVTLSGVALLCGATAFAQATTADSAQNGSSMSSMSSGKASKADKMFARKALEGGMAEVQLGQLAAKNAGSDDVKQFGQKMVDDHTKLGDQLKPIAEQLGVTAPTTLSAKDKALMTKLQGESGEQFDKTYLKAMVKDHRKDLKEFQKEARSGKDQSLKDAASQGAEVIQGHLSEAEQLAQTHHVSVPGGKNSGSSSGQGSESQ
jgi:putative membrane protein